MNPIDIEQYKKDMMRLYGRRTPDSAEAAAAVEKTPEVKPEEPQEVTPLPDNVPEESEPEQVITPPADDIPEESPPEQEQENTPPPDIPEKNSLEEFEERFPEPDLLSELESEELSSNSYATPESMGSSTGYILVNVRAGHDAYPIVNASVIVSAIVDGNRLFIASGQTDISGATIKLQTPAPDIIYSQSPGSDVRPYSLFDISVTAGGYFNARSVDVPVFSGITSIQNFNMIPVPLLMNSSDETLTYFNQEPNYR